MPHSILLLSVGGSHQPIVTSILQHRPDFVYFLCSGDVGKTKGSYHQVAGEGKVLKSNFDLDKPDLPNIATLANLQAEQFAIRCIDSFDDLNACYLKTMEVIAEARRTNPKARILVDYTGGTKSMTAGLAAAALDDGHSEISLVAGRRGDLVKVQDQTEFVRPVHVWDAQAMRRLRAARELLDRYDYASAEQLLCDAAARFASERTLSTMERGIALCRAFDAWDKFQHQTARNLLQAHQGEFIGHWRLLKVLVEETPGHGFEWIEDLLRNAERRASQERFDDALGRMYRAVELTAQIWLQKTYNIDSGDVKLERIPNAQHEQLERCRDKDNTIKIGLLLAWDLIAALEREPLGKLFTDQRARLLDFLKVRNASLFAHGYRPVSEADYRKHATGVMAFLRNCIDAAIKAGELKRPVVLEQLPTDFLAGIQESPKKP